MRSQIASNQIGQHVQSGDAGVALRLHDYASAVGHDVSPLAATGRAVVVLAQVVRSAAATQGVIDGFATIAGLTALALALVVLHKPAPIGPASHLPLFAGRRSSQATLSPEARA
jgi:hypothetical protein